MDIRAQQPAQGILKRNDWGDAMTYQVVCECSDPNHDHRVWVEADNTEVVVTTYTQQKTKWWDLNRFQIIWQLLTKGYIEYEASIIMTRQQAINYASVLQQAVEDVETFRKQK
jgi:hypothetical protein